MPKFPTPDTIPDREQAINAIIASIAMEETALAKLIEAESEKIKYAIKTIDPNSQLCLLLKFNESAANLIGLVNEMQMILKNKLQTVTKYIPIDPCPPHPPIPPIPPHPPHPPKPPHPPCVSEFVGRGIWYLGKSLFLTQKHCCGDGVKVQTNDCGSSIILNKSKKYNIKVTLEVNSQCSCKTRVELIHQSHCKVFLTKSYTPEKGKILTDEFVITTPDDIRSNISLRTKNTIDVVMAQVLVMEK